MAEQAEQVKNNFELKMEEAKADAESLLAFVEYGTSQQEVSRTGERNSPINKIVSKSLTSPVDGSHQDDVAPGDSLQTEQHPINKIAPKSLTFPVDGLHQDDIITP